VFGADVEMQGAGRTDAGVHALGQVMLMKVTAAVKHSPETIKRRLNDALPADIAILDVQRAPRNFHAPARRAIAVVRLSDIGKKAGILEALRVVDQRRSGFEADGCSRSVAGRAARFRLFSGGGLHPGRTSRP
jgi:hypothetical protein